MASSPPQLRHPGADHGVKVDPARFAAAADGESGVCFAIDGAGLEDGQSRLVGDTAVLTTRVAGRVARVSEDELELSDGERSARVRHVLPPGISLAGLVGRQIEVEVTHRIGPFGATAIDAYVRDGRGRVLLWAHDGPLARERPSSALQIRIASAADGAPRLAIAVRRAVTTVSARMWATVDGGDATYVALALRVRADDAAFVLART